MVDGDEIELTPAPDWQWVIPRMTLPVRAIQPHFTKSEGKAVIVEADIIAAGPTIATVTPPPQYMTPAFPTPGMATMLTLMVDAPTLSKAVKDLGQAVATVGTTGTFIATMVPAVNPAGAADVPVKQGTWKVAKPNQQRSTKSGTPSGSDGESGSGGVATADGSGAETTDHFVAVDVEDIDGKPLAGSKIVIHTPDGRSVGRTLTSKGSARVDGIRTEDECVVVLAELVPPPDVAVDPNFIAIDLVDVDGAPLVGAIVEVVTPTGRRTRVTSGSKGGIKVNNLVLDGDCQITVLDRGTPGQTEIGDPGADGPGLDDGSGSDSGGGTGGGDTSEDVDQKQVFVLRLPGALFRTNSCAVMPEGEAPSEDEHGSLTSTGMFASALRFASERPDLRLFVAGHTDTTGTVEFNQTLSEERAKVALAVVKGDREAFKKLVNERYNVSDYKQYLSWCTKGLEGMTFTCDPGPIDDNEASSIEAVRTFQREYNAQRGLVNGPEALREDGDVGPMTWAALFDVLQLGIAEELGEDLQGKTKLQSELKFVDDARQALGFSEHHPIEGAGEDNLESQTNRRVELLFFKAAPPDHVPDLGRAETDPGSSEVYVPPDEFVRVPIDLGPTLERNGSFPLFTRTQGPLEGTFRLSTPFGFEQSKLLSEAVPDGELFRLDFTGIPPEGKFSLHYKYDEGDEIEFFVDTELSAIQGGPPSSPDDEAPPPEVPEESAEPDDFDPQEYLSDFTEV